MPADPAVRLEPFDDNDFAAWLVLAVPSYAAEHVAEGSWAPHEALALSQQAHAALLPQGLATPGHAFCHLVAGEPAQRVGWLWWADAQAAGRPGVYVYGLEVDEAQRGRGHGRAALAELERLARALGLGFLGLHVFGHNPGARRLYEACGFVATSITMRKGL